MTIKMTENSKEMDMEPPADEETRPLQDMHFEA